MVLTLYQTAENQLDLKGTYLIKYRFAPLTIFCSKRYIRYGIYIIQT